MNTLQNIIIILIFATLCSCKNLSTSKTEKSRNDSIVIDTTGISNHTNNTAAFTNNEEAGTITTIKFNEFSISINRLVIYEEDKKIAKIQKDTVEIYAEIGETIEGQLISFYSDQLTLLTVEQRYETSVTIMNEGQIAT